MTISKLVIVRTLKKNLSDPAVQTLGTDFGKFFDAEVEMPIAIIPIAWGVENLASHVGFVLSGMRLNDLMKLKEWEADPRFAPVSTVLPLGETEDAVSVALAGVGLRIHPLA
jgi:hypothetical protein